ncbi:NADH-quinone oxidoreductase subunit D-related protein [Microlunatus soli]|uniref:NADH dehydrogenase subunit D n=1 Tax=Microlunatus soli TaxID=630515 RepID=A0A1H1SJU6_9ACTN|nr:hypothetical protein [Microlunatus soli]SDS48267.1 NADH dehydrogenase subunit D [Microlunatus soli]
MTDAATEHLRVLIGSPAIGTVATPEPHGVLLLDLGADHPSRAGLLELRIWRGSDAAGTGVVERAEVVVGAMHRGVEKLYEVRDYRQILMLADRHDWQAPAAAELSIALACERLLGLQVPERATWLRTLLAEHTRLLSHLGFLGYLWHRTGDSSPVHELRERLRNLLQRWTGNRVHPMINRLGGLAADVDDGWLDDEAALMIMVRSVADAAAQLLAEPGLSAGSAAIPALTPALISEYGVSGPAARAAGVDLDLRRDQPYLCYAELRAELTDQHGLAAELPAGTAAARLATMIDELRNSATMINTMTQRLRAIPGPVGVRLAKIVKLPEGEIYAATEAPLGMAGCYVVSRGEKTPWRLKLRTPSFNNVSALEAMLPGCPVSELELALASVGYVVGDIDK